MSRDIYLYPGLGESSLTRQLLSRIHIGVMCPLESFLQVLQLIGAKRRSVSTLFSALRCVVIATRIKLVANIGRSIVDDIT